MLDFFSNLLSDDYDSDYIEIIEKGDFYTDVQITGELPFHNSTISIRAYSTKKKQSSLAFRCKWFRVVDQRNYEIRDNTVDDTYNLNAYDIGSSIKIAVKVKGMKPTILRIGPIALNPKIYQSLENSILANEGLFNFALVKYGDRYVDDESDFQNFVRFTQTNIQFKFGFLFEHVYSDFELDLNGPYDYKIICDNYDPRNLSIFFPKGTEKMLTDNILLTNPQKKRRYEQLEKQFRKKAQIYKEPAGVELFGSDNVRERPGSNKKQFEVQKDEEFDGIEFELRIRFESRLLRDTFVSAVRVVAVLKSVAIAEMIDNSESVFKNEWKFEPLGDPDDLYNNLVGQTYKLGESIKRVLGNNKIASGQNSKLNNEVAILEKKLMKSLEDFSKLKKELRSEMNEEDQKKMDKVAKNLLDTSVHVQRMKGGKGDKKKFIEGRKNNEKKAKGLEKELEATNKLNSILLKEIERLKGSGNKSSSKKKQRSKVNATMLAGKQTDFKLNENLNKSELGAEKGKQYLIGLEEKLKKVREQKQELKVSLF